MLFQELMVRLSQRQADFEDVLAYIGQHYRYVPTRFSNGVGEAPLQNEAGQNEGSCRVFALARLEKLSEQETLMLFGRFYQDDVLKQPNGSSHANIRRFMRDGWSGIHFEGAALLPLEKAPAH